MALLVVVMVVSYCEASNNLFYFHSDKCKVLGLEAQNLADICLLVSSSHMWSCK